MNRKLQHAGDQNTDCQKVALSFWFRCAKGDNDEQSEEPENVQKGWSDGGNRKLSLCLQRSGTDRCHANKNQVGEQQREEVGSHKNFAFGTKEMNSDPAEQFSDKDKSQKIEKYPVKSYRE